MGTNTSLLFTSFLSFPDKRMAAPPCLNFKHIFLVATTLIQACVPSCSSSTHALSAVAVRGCGGNVTELFGFTDDKARTERFLVSTLTSARSLCLVLIFLATHTLPPLSD